MQILQIYISMVNTWINKSLKKAPVFARSCTAENCSNDAEAYLLSFLCEFTEWSLREGKIWNSAGGMHTMWLNQCTLKSTVHSVELHTYLTFYTFSVWTIIALPHLEFCALKKTHPAIVNPVKCAFCSISYTVVQRYQRFPKHKILSKAVVALDVGTEGL